MALNPEAAGKTTAFHAAGVGVYKKHPVKQAQAPKPNI